MQGTGGVSKLRSAKEGGGKANLFKTECNVLNKLTNKLGDNYRRQS